MFLYRQLTTDTIFYKCLMDARFYLLVALFFIKSNESLLALTSASTNFVLKKANISIQSVWMLAKSKGAVLSISLNAMNQINQKHKTKLKLISRNRQIATSIPISSGPNSFEADVTGLTAFSGSNQPYLPFCKSSCVIVSRNLFISAVIAFSAVQDFSSIPFSTNNCFKVWLSNNGLFNRFFDDSRRWS